MAYGEWTGCGGVWWGDRRRKKQIIGGRRGGEWGAEGVGAGAGGVNIIIMYLLG